MVKVAEPQQMIRRKRKRIKHTLQTVQEQVEFYFSDANLRRDKFFLQKTGSNGTKPVPIHVLKSFNCIKKLSVNEQTIIRAIKNSTLLTVNEHLKTIQRKFVLQEEPANTDDCTVYIDCLPPDATIAWLKGICKKLGTAKYISLPRQQNGSIKGFCFIEFSCPEEALTAYSSLNFPRKNFFPNRTAEYLTSLQLEQVGEEEEMDTISSAASSVQHACIKSSEDSQAMPHRNQSHLKNADIEISEQLKSSFQHRQATRLLSSVTTVKENIKRRGKRIRKSKKNAKTKQDPPQIRAIMKTDWLELKESYVRMQRKEMGRLKSILQSLSSDLKHTSGFIKVHNSRSNDIWDFDDSSNQYDIDNRQSSEEEKTKRAAPSFTPGVVAKVQCLDSGQPNRSLPEFKVLKHHLFNHGKVAYVDVAPKATEGFVRFEDSVSAQRAVLNEEKFSLRLLTGEEEEKYWDRLLVSRQMKRSRERPRIRGRDRITKRAKNLLLATGRKHIKFNQYFNNTLQ
uniref:la-related protein 7-like n=1 Tax=Ciona intestinalis TaxID=7719 RepID=UPI000180D421|nr:la-related protein 7-like [Ciona intestinalis]|eukprot:XP_026691414.1 la-related protein 7-like [Ciona intestinalis]